MTAKSKFISKRDPIGFANFDEIGERLIAFLDWIEQQAELLEILEFLNAKNGEPLLEDANKHGRPPRATTAEEIASVGYELLKYLREKKIQLWDLALTFHIMPSYSTNQLSDYVDAVMSRYVNPFLNALQNFLRDDEPKATPVAQPSQSPPEIAHSLARFKKDHDDPSKVGFLIMRFEDTDAHSAIQEALKATLKKHGLTAVRADEKRYHDDLFYNVQTYLHGCSFGIAIFERISTEDFNPNVSLEVGYLLAMRIPVLLLKDQNLKAMQTDLVGKIYDPFDFQKPAETIPPKVEKWLQDKGIVV